MSLFTYGFAGGPATFKVKPVLINTVVPGSWYKRRHNAALLTTGKRGTPVVILTSVLISGNDPQSQFAGFSQAVLMLPFHLFSLSVQVEIFTVFRMAACGNGPKPLDKFIPIPDRKWQ